MSFLNIFSILGYYKLLKVILNLLNFSAKLGDIDEDTLLQFIFPDESSENFQQLASFFPKYWGLHYLQIQCACLISGRFAEKQSVDDLLANSIHEGLSHRDHRVRLIAATSLPYILRKFTNHLAVYNSLLKPLGNDEYEEGKAEEEHGALNTVSTLIAMTTMTARSSRLIEHSIAKIITNCCFTLDDTIFSSCGLLYRLLGHISTLHGYSSTVSFCSEYSFLIFFTWFQNGHSIRKFPFLLFEETSIASFLQRYVSSILPITLMLPDDHYRTSSVTDFAYLLDYGKGKAGVAALLAANVVSIKALDYFISASSEKSSIAAFLSLYLTEENIIKLTRNYISDLILVHLVDFLFSA